MRFLLLSFLSALLMLGYATTGFAQDAGIGGAGGAGMVSQDDDDTDGPGGDGDTDDGGCRSEVGGGPSGGYEIGLALLLLGAGVMRRRRA